MVDLKHLWNYNKQALGANNLKSISRNIKSVLQPDRTSKEYIINTFLTLFPLIMVFLAAFALARVTRCSP